MKREPRSTSSIFRCIGMRDVMRAMLARTWTACVLCLLVTAVAPRAEAQAARDLLSVEQRVELDAIEAQARVSTGLYVTAGILTIGGMTTLLAASIALGVCDPPNPCSGAEITIGVGGLSVGIGLIFLLVATLVEGDANAWRRRLLRESLEYRPGRAALDLSIARF
jgi:hypothetical protein